MVKVKPLKVEAEVITSFVGQAIGFMFHPRGKKAKLFKFSQERQVGIHMLFVFFPLIVVWLDKSKRARHFMIMRPFTSLASHQAKYVLEVPYERKILAKIRKGMKLKF